MSGETTEPLFSSDAIDVKRLRLKPGDIIIAKADRNITAEEARRLKEQVERQIPGHRVLVTSGVTIEIIEPADD